MLRWLPHLLTVYVLSDLPSKDSWKTHVLVPQIRCNPNAADNTGQTKYGSLPFIFNMMLFKSHAMTLHTILWAA